MNAAILFATLLSAPPASTAHEVQPTLPSMGITFGVKVGPYRPDVDSEPALEGKTPYRDIFGKGSGVTVVPQIRVLRPVGPFDFGLALSAGWHQRTAKALLDDSADGSAPSTSNRRSGGETSMRVVPISLLAVVRWNGLYEHTGFPFVPYVEVGGAYASWWIGRGANHDAESGGTAGWQLNAGVALRIDRLDPTSAKALDHQFGVKGTELTFEWSHLALDGFGRSGVLRVGDSTWVAGLAVGF